MFFIINLILSWLNFLSMMNNIWNVNFRVIFFFDVKVLCWLVMILNVGIKFKLE